MISSCSEKEPAFIKTSSQQSYSLNSQSNFVPITFTTNYSWIANASASWLNVSPSSGNSGDNTIMITLSENKEYDPRSGTINILAEDASILFSITQNQKEELILSETKYHVGSSGGELAIPIKSSVYYTCNVLKECKDWINIAKTRALENYQILLQISPNDGFDKRIGEIEIKYSDKTEKITIEQSQLDEMIISTTEFEIGCDGGEIIVPISTNIDYNAEVIGEASNWLSIKYIMTRSLEDYKLVLQANKNAEYNGRVGQVKVSALDKESIITINQSPSLFFEVSNHQFNLSYDEHNISFNIKSNVELNVYSDEEWIDLAETRSIESRSYEFSIDRNNNDARTGFIYIDNSENNRIDSISIFQEGKTINGHDFVELAGYKWATTNVGADSPLSVGIRYQQKDALNAPSEWGGSWKLPTKEQWEALTNFCYWEMAIEGETRLVRIRDPKDKDRYINLVCTGYYNPRNETIGSSNADGAYWSSTPYDYHYWYVITFNLPTVWYSSYSSINPYFELFEDDYGSTIPVRLVSE